MILSPSFKVYIGLTKTTVRKRWLSHIHRANKENRNHPLYNAIRKYGTENFCVDTLHTGLSIKEARNLEKQEIAVVRTEWPGMSFNISDGGETDGEFGSKIFWDSMNKDKEAKRKYLEKLSNIKKENDWSDYAALTAANMQWRKDNPKLAYKMSTRALRVINNAKGAKRNTEPPKGPIRESKKVALYKKSKISRMNALKQWEKRTEEEKEQLADKIRESVKSYYEENPDYKEKVAKQLESARDCIDREKQGKAASRGIKHFWIELKKDPVRYAEHIARRKATLIATLERKKNDKQNV